MQRAGSIIDMETGNLCTRARHWEMGGWPIVEEGWVSPRAEAHVVVALMVRIVVIFAGVLPWAMAVRRHAVKSVHHSLMSTGAIVGSLARIDNTMSYVVAVDVERELIPSSPLSLDVGSRRVGYEYPLPSLLI